MQSCPSFGINKINNLHVGFWKVKAARKSARATMHPPYRRIMVQNRDRKGALPAANFG
jgi:hypothetical protein